MSKRKTTEQFIIDVIKVHNNFYDYSLVAYKDCKTKIKIICPIHGIFEQQSGSHLSGCGCPICCGGIKFNTEEFIEKSKLVHNNFYDYSLVDYINAHIKIKIICPIHGIFEQVPNSHLLGNGCRKCATYLTHQKQKFNTEEFIEKSKLVHNNFYDYSLVDYINAQSRIKIICPIHGVFEQIPNNHLRDRGCKKCAGTVKSNTEEFIEKSKLVHNNFYDYSLVEYIDARIKIKIICPIHGIFEQVPNSHLNGNGCSKCNSSKGEIEIENHLKNNNIFYVNQKRFKDCINIKPLPFDFYLSDYNICIEYDGEQHFRSVKTWGGEERFIISKKKDAIKTKYCEDNGIKLIRIPYWEKDNIEDILKKEVI